jgi:hypothetical protein
VDLVWCGAACAECAHFPQFPSHPLARNPKIL